jgi:hypothetical protein
MRLMSRVGFAIICALSLCGCDAPPPYSRSVPAQEMFGPSSIRIHPTFTQVRDFNGDGKLDGIEALLEVQDQFGEPARSTGRVMFELFEYRRDSEEIRGRRIGGPWAFSLDTKTDQEQHWTPTLRGYTFQLPFPLVSASRSYVLTAQLDVSEADGKALGGRLFDRMIVEGTDDGRGHHKRASSRSPGH